MKTIPIILGLMMAFAIVPLVSANHLCFDARCSVGSNQGHETAQTETKKSSGGSGFLVPMYWNGEQCVKRDVYGMLVKTNPTSTYNTERFIFLDIEGVGYYAPLLKGEWGTAWDKETKKVTNTCDKTQTDASPEPMSWWRN